ncbi:PEP-CTERM sorting domain-containing protein [Pseudorhodoferax sp.]|uniref:PEP-CTERM sorting domain-containing protein n=1 Tax=Pseudorhodoferax sp. TaxID=1993553 RepID=UPI002DD65804|nr:PEP-CTERM sorting domain-containing protein [Pseudorhodoferax sp.]
MALRTVARRWLAGIGLAGALWGAVGACHALVITAGSPTTVVPAEVADVGVVLGAGQFLLPILASDAARLQDWRFDLFFDPAVVQPVDLGGFYQGAYAALFSAAQPVLSSIVSGGLLLDGVLLGIAGASDGVSGDGLLAFIGFEYLATGVDPGFEVGVEPPPMPIPEPGTVALMVAAMAALAGRRRAWTHASEEKK